MCIPIFPLMLSLLMVQPPDASPRTDDRFLFEHIQFGDIRVDAYILDLLRRQPPEQRSEEPDDEGTVPGSRRLRYLVAEAAHLSRISIYVDSTLQSARVIPPSFAIGTTESAVEKWLGDLLPKLPEGATWVKLYLPPPPKERKWTGDSVAGFTSALSNLYGRVGSVEDGKSEILSKQIHNEQAKDIKEKVGLQPVYLLTLRGSRSFTGRWKTTFGDMTLRTQGKRVTGTYTANDGTITGFIRGGVLYFDWFEKATQSRGKGLFTLNEDGVGFSGKWGTDDNEPISPWVGERTL